MVELFVGILLVLAWAWLQFIVQPATGLIHLLLAAGVLLIIRGIVRLTPGR